MFPLRRFVKTKLWTKTGHAEQSEHYTRCNVFGGSKVSVQGSTVDSFVWDDLQQLKKRGYKSWLEKYHENYYLRIQPYQSHSEQLAVAISCLTTAKFSCRCGCWTQISTINRYINQMINNFHIQNHFASLNVLKSKLYDNNPLITILWIINKETSFHRGLFMPVSFRHPHIQKEK